MLSFLLLIEFKPLASLLALHLGSFSLFLFRLWCELSYVLLQCSALPLIGYLLDSSDRLLPWMRFQGQCLTHFTHDVWPVPNPALSLCSVVNEWVSEKLTEEEEKVGKRSRKSRRLRGVLLLLNSFIHCHLSSCNFYYYVTLLYAQTE